MKNAGHYHHTEKCFLLSPPEKNYFFLGVAQFFETRQLSLKWSENWILLWGKREKQNRKREERAANIGQEINMAARAASEKHALWWFILFFLSGSVKIELPVFCTCVFLGILAIILVQYFTRVF